MVKERELITVNIDPESDLAKALAESGAKPIVLISTGERFEVTRAEDDPADDYDAEAFRAALRAAAGTFTPDEAEQLKQDIYHWREEGTRPVNGPRYLPESD